VSVVAVRTPARRWATIRLQPPVLVVSLASLLAALVAGFLRLRLYQHGSPNNDEAVYLHQAMGLTHGHLVVPFNGDIRARQPWLFAIGAHGYVSKYLPVVAGVYAIGLALFGSVTPILIALAAAVPLLTYRLGRAVGLSAHRAAVGAVLVGCSPAILAEGGLVLSYLPFLVFALACWCAVFAAADSARARARWAAGAALLGALGACVRPLDVVLLLGPTLVWLAWRSRRSLVVLGAMAAAVAPVGLLVLAYDQHVTGKALKLPFSMLDPNDKVGFGDRRFFPEDVMHHYGFKQALVGTSRHFLIEPSQAMFGLLAVLVLAAWAMRPGGPAGERARLLVGCSALTLAAYFCFWGPWHASVYWGWTRTVGPFYSIALFPPVVLAALRVPWRPRTLTALLLLGSLHPAVHSVDVWHRMHRDHRDTTTILALLDPKVPTLLDADPPYLGHPVSGLWQPNTYLASWLSPSRVSNTWRMLVLDSYPYRPVSKPQYDLRQVVVSTGSDVGLQILRTGKSKTAQLLVISRGGVATACLQPVGGVHVDLTATGVTGCTGMPVPHSWARRPYRACPDAGCLIVTWFAQTPSGKWRAGPWRRLPVEVANGKVRLVTDGKTLKKSGSGWIAVRAR
jgi:hypothetical protein